jgi:calcineurin-like phosphoesterase family protein
MSKYWFTSDLHLGHANIIQLCGRPFKDIEDMDKQLINNWNSRVKPEDYIIHLGDFCYRDRHKFNQYFNNLSGNIIFIRGNHDKNNGVRTPITDMTIRYGGYNIFLTHRPEDVVNFNGLVLCGHVHQNWKFRRDYFNSDGIYPDLPKNTFTDYCNVGVDVWNFYPITINEIMGEYDKWKLSQ